MEKISLFKVRVINEKRVYLLASDVMKALGYMQNNPYGLTVVCKYFGCEEK